MQKQFKELNLDQSKLERSFQDYCKANGIEKYRLFVINKKLKRAEYVHDGKTVMLDFYFT